MVRINWFIQVFWLLPNKPSFNWDPYTELSPVQKNPARSRDRVSFWRALEQAAAINEFATRAEGVAGLAASAGFIWGANVGGITTEVIELAGSTAAHITLLLPTSVESLISFLHFASSDSCPYNHSVKQSSRQTSIQHRFMRKSNGKNIKRTIRPNPQDLKDSLADIRTVLASSVQAGAVFLMACCEMPY